MHLIYGTSTEASSHCGVRSASIAAPTRSLLAMWPKVFHGPFVLISFTTAVTSNEKSIWRLWLYLHVIKVARISSIRDLCQCESVLTRLCTTSTQVYIWVCKLIVSYLVQKQSKIAADRKPWKRQGLMENSPQASGHHAIESD